MNWESIYIKEAPKLLAVCRRYVQDLQKAEDLMHDAFLTAIKKQDQYTGKGAIGAWLRRVTVNTVLMYLRKEKGVLELLDNDVERPVSIFEKDEPQDAKSLILAAKFENADLLAAIDALPAHHKVVFNLYVFEGFTHKEIGQKLNISPGTSKSHLARARKKIQKTLAKKAVEMKKKNKRAGIIPFLFGGEKENYLDNMFRENLGENSLAPQGNLPPALQKALKSSAPVSSSAFLGIKSLLLVSFASLAVISFIILSSSDETTISAESVTLSKENAHQTLPTKEIKPIEKASETVIDEKLEIKPEQVKVQKPKEKKVVSNTEKTKKLPPVIIKKNVIVRDTVYEITIDRNK